MGPMLRRPVRMASKWGMRASRIGRYGLAAQLGYGAYRYARKRLNKRSKMRMIGDRIGSSTAKKVYVTNDVSITSFATRDLYSDDLIKIGKKLNASTGPSEINQRERDVANVRGVKICWEVMNVLDVPVYMNWAIVTPKNDLTTSISKIDWFRDYSVKREQSFDSTLTSNEMHCLPINADRYIVHSHQRTRLAPKNGNTSALYNVGGQNIRTIMKYIPVKRQFRFDGNSTEEPSGRQLFLVWWFDEFLSASGHVTVPNAVQCNRREICYFREPKA